MYSPRTTYLITRVHGLKTHLIRRDDLTSMVKAKGLKEVTEILLKTDYAKEISMIPEGELDASTLERVFQKKLMDRTQFLLKASPSQLNALLREYFRRFEVENLKRIIRAKHVGEIIEESSLIPLDREYTLVNFSALLEASDVREVIDLLKETVYAILSKQLELYNEYKTTLILEACLDDLYYKRLWDLEAKKEVRRLFAIEVDLKNLLIILGMKMREVEAGFIEKNIIQAKEGLSRRTLSTLIKGSVEDAPNIVTVTLYRRLLIESLDFYNKKLFSDLENLFHSYQYKLVSQIFQRHQFDVGYVFAYLSLCEAEAKNLAAISLCKELGMGEEELKKFIINI